MMYLDENKLRHIWDVYNECIINYQEVFSSNLINPKQLLSKGFSTYEKINKTIGADNYTVNIILGYLQQSTDFHDFCHRYTSRLKLIEIIEGAINE